MMRGPIASLLLLGVLAAPAGAQAPVAESPARTAETVAADYCGFLRAQIGQAEQTLRQLVATINATARVDAPAQTLGRTAFMDHWVGRLSGLLEATTPANCFEPEQLDQARQVAAQYTAFAAQARDFATRTPEAAAPSASTTVQRRRERREQQRREQDFQQSILP